MWISAPTLAFSSGEPLHNEGNLVDLVQGHSIFLALEDVDSETLRNTNTEELDMFIGLHIAETAPDDWTHIHGTLDGCCAAGGLVCDAGLTFSTMYAPYYIGQLTHCAHSVSNLSGIETPPLYHPPKV